MNLKIPLISKKTGQLLYILSIFQIAPMLFSMLISEGHSFYVDHFASFCVTLILATICYFPYKNVEGALDLSGNMLLAVFSWLLFSIAGSALYIFTLELSVIDALFETVSGFTTTGMTILTGLEEIPKSILLWRAMTQWIGGAGVLAFVLFITLKHEKNLWEKFLINKRISTTANPIINIKKTFVIFLSIYALYTIVQTIVMRMLGVNLFDSFTHSLTTISTGGFSNYDLNIEQLLVTNARAEILEYVMTFFMMVGGISFFIHYRFIKRRMNDGLSDEEFRYFIGIIIAAITVILFTLWHQGGIRESSFESSIFRVVSMITTTGFRRESLSIGEIYIYMLLWLVLIGGCVGSTSGGFKIARVISIWKIFRKEIKQLSTSKGIVLTVHTHGNIISQREQATLMALLFGWIFTFTLGALFVRFFSDFSSTEVIEVMVGAISNYGQGGISAARMSEVGNEAKIGIMAVMLMGRLEILPIVLLFNRHAWKK